MNIDSRITSYNVCYTKLLRQKLNDVVADAISSSTVNVQNGEDTKDINEVIENAMSSYKDFSYTFISDGDEFDKLQSMLMEGTIIESRDEAAAEELLDVFRWTERNNFV